MLHARAAPKEEAGCSGEEDEAGPRNAPSETLVVPYGVEHAAKMDAQWLRLQQMGERAMAGLCADKVALVTGAATGIRLNGETFVMRISWARFLVTVRYALEHIRALRWLPLMPRSPDFVHLFIRLAGRQLGECAAQGDALSPDA